jgi:hypothetical protein
MKRVLFGILAGAVLTLSSAPAAEASAFLSITVSGTTLTCDNSAAFTATNCGAGFDTSANANNINFTGTINGVSFGNANTEGVQLFSNQPGSEAGSFVSDTKSFVTNTSGSARAIQVDFAVNNFSLPSGSPLTLSSSQSVNTISTSGGLTQTFTGWGNAANTLAVGVGTAAATPNCVAASGVTKSCGTNSPDVSFARAGNFALSGRQNFSPERRLDERSGVGCGQRSAGYS